MASSLDGSSRADCVRHLGEMEPKEERKEGSRGITDLPSTATAYSTPDSLTKAQIDSSNYTQWAKLLTKRRQAIKADHAHAYRQIWRKCYGPRCFHSSLSFAPVIKLAFPRDASVTWRDISRKSHAYNQPAHQ